MDAATALINRAVAQIFGATALPGMELAHGIRASSDAGSGSTLLTSAEVWLSRSSGWRSIISPAPAANSAMPC